MNLEVGGDAWSWSWIIWCRSCSPVDMLQISMQHPTKVKSSSAADGGGFAVGGDLTLGGTAEWRCSWAVGHGGIWEF